MLGQFYLEPLRKVSIDKPDGGILCSLSNDRVNPLQSLYVERVREEGSPGMVALKPLS